jgi:predicted transcriptional regulator
MKLKIKGLNKEMSTTGTGASFTPGTGAQYATPKAFKKKKDEIGEPFTKPNPSIPNRKSKFFDYKQIFEDNMEELKFNPIKDFTDSQAWAGDNTGYDMDTQDAASVLELAKISKGGQFKVGDVQKSKGVEYTVTNIDPITGQISWKIDYVPAFDTVYKKFDDLRDAMGELDRRTNDSTIDTISDRMKGLFNQYRTYIRKNYPDEYKKFQTAENIDPKSQAKHKGKSAPFGSAYEPVKEINEELGVSKGILTRAAKEFGEGVFTDMILNIRDENVQDEIVSAFDDQYPGFRNINIRNLSEARYSQFKTETKLRTPTEQIHRAVREIRRKIDEMVKVVGHTERMKSELKGSNEGMSYLKRTRNAINTISEKLQELNNRIKGLTE